MQSAASTEHRQFTTRARLIIAVLGVVMAAVMIFALAAGKEPSPAAFALDAKLAQLRADAVPLTAAEIAKVLPDPDPGHDAREVLNDVFAVSRGPLGGDIPVAGGGTMPKRTEAFAASVLQSMNLYLSHSDTMLEKIPDHLDGVWFSMGWTNGFTNLTQYPLTEIRDLMQALAVKAIYEAERGEARKAAEALCKGFSVVTTLNGDSLVSVMVRVACADMMCTAAERTLNRVQVSASDLLELEQRINIERIDNFEDTFMVERHMGMLLLDAVRQGHDFISDSTIKLLVWKLMHLFEGEKKKFYRDEDYLLFLNVIDERRTAHQLPGIERVRRNEQLDAYYATNTQTLAAEMVMPNWKKAIRTATEVKARLTALKAALAIERYRLAHDNAIPGGLDALAPQDLPSSPRDPMDEQPLRFKRLPRGYVVYSIGADAIDNSGTERGTLTNNYDITVTIER